MAAHPLSFSLSLPSSKLLHHNTTTTTTTFSIKPIHLKKTTIFKKLNTLTIPKAIQDSNQNNTSSETDQNPPPENNKITGDDDDDVALSDVGSEIKKLMKEREGKEPDFWSGVVEEIREIEWPVFGKVLSTTGVVIGVIAGSSVVLLTLNAVLAELSDKVFAGKGVQDFFG
ncbi:preprotein translocase subunit SECE1 [Lycium ferocissimum]|uniref:preprotein translocase subunit SECE1 n=1 Tax=Lycium ferocissimum TaxID=112874 RepID=UPI0028150767|nr:preprotein translocase subunit SECE1 [Lycium ferocissimum]